MTITIKTDHKWRDLVYRHDVPTKVLVSEFDYHGPDEGLDGFFCYRGRWYHVDGFMTVRGALTELQGWDGYASDSYFSGVVIRLSSDGEQVMCATYYS